MENVAAALLPSPFIHLSQCDLSVCQGVVKVRWAWLTDWLTYLLDEWRTDCLICWVTS